MPTKMRFSHTLFSRFTLHFAIIPLFVLLSSPSTVAKQLETGNHSLEKTQSLALPADFFLIDSLPERDRLYKVQEIEISPEFPGGVRAFLSYLSKNFKYPQKARENNISGKQIMQFVVERDGSLTDIKVVRGLGSGLDEASVQLLKISPKWKPGFHNGDAVRVLFTLPISLNLSGGRSQ